MLSRVSVASIRRAASTQSRLTSVAVRGFKTSIVPRSEGTPSQPPASPEVQAIIDKILQLNVMQCSELVKNLKTTFGYTDAAFMAAPSAAPAGGAAAAPAAAAAEEKPKAAEKTSFSVKLESFDAKDKIKVIKEVRAVTGKGLKEAKDLVESLPQVLKKDIKKDEADKLVQLFKDNGAVCVLE